MDPAGRKRVDACRAHHTTRTASCMQAYRCDSIHLKWASVDLEGRVRYSVQSQEGQMATWSNVYSGTQNKALITGLLPTSTHKFRLKVFTDDRTSEWSAPVVFTTTSESKVVLSPHGLTHTQSNPSRARTYTTPSRTETARRSTKSSRTGVSVNYSRAAIPTHAPFQSLVDIDVPDRMGQSPLMHASMLGFTTYAHIYEPLICSPPQHCRGSY